MSEFLDELARSMAKPMPRRRALRLLGASLVAAAVPLARPGLRQARAARLAPNACGDPGLCPPTGRSMVCGCVVNQFACYKTCCDPTREHCCLFAGEPDGKPPCEKACCPLGTECGSGKGGDICVCKTRCGSTCCGPEEYCANFQQQLCCKRGERGCGLECCRPNEECRKIRVGTGSKDVCTKRCPSNQAWCGKDNCCPPKWKCINEQKGLCKRCWPEEEECEKKCCDRKTTRCCGKAGCCPKNRSCCVTGKTQKCCPAGQKCAIPILAGNIGVVPNTDAVCCPAERLSKSPTLCCPPGQVALNSPGFRTPPPGISPYCCPRGQICPSSSGPACVDFQTDPQNCGTCGNACASGECVRGVCVLS